ncbi:hypothetical protein NP493_880g00078 [Ridgeia piscesae]|uniref:Uncharacterized protein n=1 Tax=Ridgeia piscesae TaxID=27915 RepID=A0AAD9NNA3_RIDPI|nr:hypothetical protein NP493_880g00078 [Ridgeia piscesae]
MDYTYPHTHKRGIAHKSKTMAILDFLTRFNKIAT